jgi:proteasome regulatory subunit
MPNFEARHSIYLIHTKRMNLDSTVNLEEVGVRSEGATGADIKAICTEAGMFAIRENRDIVSMVDFEKAVAKVLAEDADRAMESGPMFA